MKKHRMATSAFNTNIQELLPGSAKLGYMGYIGSAMLCAAKEEPHSWNAMGLFQNIFFYI